MKREELKKKYPLSKEQHEELKRRYYAGDRIADLIKDFGLVGIMPSQLYLLFDDVTTRQKCPHCGSYLKHSPFSRQVTIHDRELVCINCNHKYSKYHYELCECDGCVKQRNYELWKFFQTEHSIDFGAIEELDVAERLYLGALHLYGRNENDGYILSYKEQKPHLCFWDKIETELIFNSLYNKRCLVVSPNSNVNNFIFDRDNKLDLDALFYDPPYELWLNKNDILKLERGDVLSDLEKNEYWRKVNRRELKSYLIRFFERNYIQNYNSRKLDRITDAYSAEFSLAEIFSAIKYITGKFKDKKEVGGNVFRYLENYYQWAKSNREQINKYAQKVFLEETTFITRYFYEAVLGDEELFYKKPNFSRWEIDVIE